MHYVLRTNLFSNNFSENAVDIKTCQSGYLTCHRVTKHRRRRSRVAASPPDTFVLICVCLAADCRLPTRSLGPLLRIVGLCPSICLCRLSTFPWQLGMFHFIWSAEWSWLHTWHPHSCTSMYRFAYIAQTYASKLSICTLSIRSTVILCCCSSIPSQ